MRTALNPMWVAYYQGNPPPPTAVRIWPGNPAPLITQSGTQAAYTLGTQFAVSSSSALQSIWWYSPSGSTALPGFCGIWDIGTQDLVTEDGFPFWQDPNSNPASPGDGWVYCDFTGAQVTLVAGTQLFGGGVPGAGGGGVVVDRTRVLDVRQWPRRAERNHRRETVRAEHRVVGQRAGQSRRVRFVVVSRHQPRQRRGLLR